MAELVHYVYAVVDADVPVAGAPPGVDDASVHLVADGAVGAVMSVLDAATYGGSSLEERVGDLEWLGPRARAHDRVVTWASDAGATVPLPMFTMFRDADAVRAMLRERGEGLTRALARVRGHREFGVRLFRIDDEVAAHLGELSPRIAELERSAEAASPGQQYLLKRKIEAERASEVRRVGGELGQRAFDALASHAAGAVLDALPRRTIDGMAGVAVLNASFLLPIDDIDAFRRALTLLVEAYEPRGFRFEFTGPWPAYHFAEETQPDG